MRLEIIMSRKHIQIAESGSQTGFAKRLAAPAEAWT
jgi:hypothetical protein